MRTHPLGRLVLLAGILIIPAQDGVAQGVPDFPATTVRVEGTDRDLADLPIVVAVDPKAFLLGPYRLRGLGQEADRPGFVVRDGDRTLLSFILDRLPAHSALTLNVEPSPDRVSGDVGVSFNEQGRRVEVAIDGKRWTTYVPDDGPKPYFDPLIGPTDVALTRSWPMREVAGEPHDHPHHRSLWFAHFDVNKANTWDQNPGHGSIQETARPTVVAGGPIGVLRTENDWLDRFGKKVCADERLVVFHATRTARVFDFAVTLKATEGPVRIGDNKDGVFGIRVAAPMAVTALQGGQILNARGLKDKAAWGQPAEWVDYTGPVGGLTMGIALLNEPTSFRFPTTWHVRDYGLFAANPFGWHDFGQAGSGAYTIPAGESIRLAYRVVLHRGSTEQAGIADWFAGYAHPPQVQVTIH